MYLDPQHWEEVRVRTLAKVDINFLVSMFTHLLVFTCVPLVVSGTRLHQAALSALYEVDFSEKQYFLIV